MPNHVHGIIEIDNCRNAPRCVLVNNALTVEMNAPIEMNAPTVCRDYHILRENHGQNAPRRVPTANNASTIEINALVEKNAPGRVPTGIQPLVKNSLSSIINHFKGNTKRFCNKNNLEYFAWQARFHDRIIQNNDGLNRIRQYIMDNPERWELDRNNPENLYM